jgi:hypothetical protein
VKGKCKTAVALVLVTIVAGQASAAEMLRTSTSVAVKPVAWRESVDDAWKESQQAGRPMLVFVTRERCFYCDKMKQSTYVAQPVVASLNADFVPLLLDGGRDSPLLRDLRVSAFPSTFVISPQAVILDRIDGYVSPETLATRLAALRARPPSAKLVSDR